MFLQKAMRYYRFWIYSCNTALFIGTLVFIIAFVWILYDERMTLFSIRLYHPTLIYGYAALLFQAGFLQTIGCLGAVRMNEKLLNLYWCAIIGLLFGDGIVGIIWVMKYNSIVTNLRFDLKVKLNEEYFSNIKFQVMWDNLQKETHCCGVDGPYDFMNMTQKFLEQEESQEIDKNKQHNYKHHHYHKANKPKVPKSCCQTLKPNEFNTILPKDSYSLSFQNNCNYNYDAELIYVYGCYDQVYEWLHYFASVLLVLGFCVISFIKLCFLCILRYEIKEMIQKIKVLKGMEDNATHAIPVHDLEAYLPRPSIVQQDSSTSQQILTGQSSAQLNYRPSICLSPNEHKHMLVCHHHHLGHKTIVTVAPTTTTTTVKSTTTATSSATNNNDTATNQNITNINLSKKHSIV